MAVKEDSNIKKTPLLDRYIQRAIQEQMDNFEEKKLTQAIKTLLHDGPVEPKNLN